MSNYANSYVVRFDQRSLDMASTFWEDLLFLRERKVAPILVAPDRESARTLVRRINRSTNAAVCVRGSDAGLLPTAGTEIGRVQIGLLHTLMDAGFVPVVEPVGYAPLGDEVDVDADAVAASVAGATEALRVFFFSERDVTDPATNASIAELTPAEALALADDDRFDPQLRSVVRAAALGVRHGVGSAQIIDGRVAHGMIMEMLTKQHIGTAIRGQVYLGQH